MSHDPGVQPDDVKPERFGSERLRRHALFAAPGSADREADRTLPGRAVRPLPGGQVRPAHRAEKVAPGISGAHRDHAPNMPVTPFEQIPSEPAPGRHDDVEVRSSRRTRVHDVATRVAAAVARIGAGPELSGWCEKFVRTCFGLPARYATARLAWLATSARHGDVHAPAGVPVFWDITSGPNADADHVALSVGGGFCVSTSAGPGRTVAKVSIQDLTRRWGMVYRGWTADYHGVLVHEGGAVSPHPGPGPAAAAEPKPAQAPVLRWPDSALPVVGWHSADSVRAWTTLMARVGYGDADLDLAMQRWLRGLGYYTDEWLLDGDFGVRSVSALQRFLQGKGLYRFAVDGDRGPDTVKAEIRYLNQQRRYL